MFFFFISSCSVLGYKKHFDVSIKLEGYTTKIYSNYKYCSDRSYCIYDYIELDRSNVSLKEIRREEGYVLFSQAPSLLDESAPLIIKNTKYPYDFSRMTKLIQERLIKFDKIEECLNYGLMDRSPAVSDYSEVYLDGEVVGLKYSRVFSDNYDYAMIYLYGDKCEVVRFEDDRLY